MSTDNNNSVNSYWFSSEFFGQFERESDKKYLYIENNMLFVGECVHPSQNKSFERWLKCAQKNCSDETSTPYNFYQIATRLGKSKSILDRKNADLREFQVFKNCFLVKKFFTTGFKKVKPNELHVLTTTNGNLDIFIPKSEMNLEDGTFEARTEYLYNKYSLEKFKKYILQPGQEYLLVSPGKCIFLFDKEDLTTHDGAPEEN